MRFLFFGFLAFLHLLSSSTQMTACTGKVFFRLLADFAALHVASAFL